MSGAKNNTVVWINQYQQHNNKLYATKNSQDTMLGTDKKCETIHQAAAFFYYFQSNH